MVRVPLVAPGSYQADVSVQDKRSGEFGNATTMATLSDLGQNTKTVIVSSLVLRSANQPGALPAETFSADSSMSLYCRVAHAQRRKNSRDASLEVQLRILKDGVAVSDLKPQALAKTVSDLIDVNGEIQLGHLDPGDYVAEVEIRDLLGDTGRNKAIARARFTVVESRD